jgi:hypothetical protein
MKTKIFLYLLLLGVGIFNANAELKHFLPNANAVMSILDQKYWFEGDTIIDNIRYTKIYSQKCESETECGDLQYYAAVRENTINEKIYCIQTMDSIERLIADFDVKVGDRIILYSYSKASNWEIVHGQERLSVLENEVRIDYVDLILIDNQYR